MKSFNPYTEDEKNRIKSIKEKNDKFEEWYKSKIEEWNKNILPLFDTIKLGFNAQNADKIADSQALSLTFRQKINEEIHFFLNKRTNEDIKLKKIKQDKFLFYATGFGLKTNLSEKTYLIDAHVSENERSVLLIENYIEFLRSCQKNLESFGFTLKNTIEFLNYLK